MVVLYFQAGSGYSSSLGVIVAADDGLSSSPFLLPFLFGVCFTLCILKLSWDRAALGLTDFA